MSIFYLFFHCYITTTQVRSNSSVTAWTVAHRTLLSMGFPRQEYWNGLLFPSAGDLPNPGIEARSPEFQVDSLPAELEEPSFKHLLLLLLLLSRFSRV